MIARLVVVGLLLPVGAMAQPVQGLYIGAGVGANFAGSPESADATTKLTTKAGVAGLGALGWGFGNGLRAELEGSDHSFSIGGVSTLRTNGLLEPLTNVTGGASVPAIMGNLAYDIPVRGLPVQPYFGGGVGYGWFDLNGVHGNGNSIIRLPDNNTARGPSIESFGTAGGFAYQAIAGLSLPVRSVAGLQLTLEYRFFGLARTDVPLTRTLTGNNRVNGVIPSATTHDGFTLADNAILIGVRYAFGGR
jgi:hypothetical protein